jgi:hypothetical protein
MQGWVKDQKKSLVGWERLSGGKFLSSNNSSFLEIEGKRDAERGGSVTDRLWGRKEGRVLGGGHRKGCGVESKGFGREVEKKGDGDHFVKKFGRVRGRGKWKVGKILSKTVDDGPSCGRPREESEVAAGGKEGPAVRFEERSLKKIRD